MGMTTTRRSPADPAGAALGVRQDRADRASPRRSIAAGVEIVSTGSTARTVADAGLPVTPVEQVTGFPGMPGRPGQDAAPEGARRPAGRSAAGVAPGPARRARHRAVRPAGQQPVPVQRNRRLRGRPGGVRRADRHRRAGHGPRRGQEPRLRRGGHLTRPVRRSCATALGSRAASPSPKRQALAAAAFVHTADLRRRRRELDGQRADRYQRGHRLPELDRRHLGQGGGAALRREPAPAGRALSRRPPSPAAWRRREQLHGKEMSYNNYVDADAARRAAYDFAEPAVAIIKHANPCGIAVGADIADGAPARPTPATRFRRSAV